MLNAATGRRRREAPLAEIKNKEELQAWLETQPRDVSVALAARAALRVLPIVQDARTGGLRGDFFAGIVLPVFRASAVAFANAGYPGHARDYARAAGDAAGAVAASNSPGVAQPVIANSAAAAARASSHAARFAFPAYAVAHASDSVESAAYAYTNAAPGAAARAAFWAAVSTDATRVEEGAAASVIAGSQLWPQPHGQPEPLQFWWQEMKGVLDAEKQDWQVWTIWYDDRLAGHVRDEERELAYVRIEEALWDQGPAIVNAEIRKRIEEQEPPPPLAGATAQHLSEIHSAWQSADAASAAPHLRRQYVPDVVVNPVALGAGGTPPAPIEAIPEQEPLATRFGVNSQGLIDIVPDPPAPGTSADALQREYYDELRLKAQVLIELSPNQLGELIGPAKRFHEGLKDRIEDISITVLWSRGNTLRSRLKAHDHSMSNAEPDPARLSPLGSETLRDLVDTWNIFIFGDPKGRELDEIRLGPQEVEAAKGVVVAGAPVVKALQQSNNVATPVAIEAVVEQAETAKTAPAGIDGDQAIDLSRKTTGNIVSELLRSVIRGEPAFAWNEYRAGIYRAGGTATAGAIGYAVYNNWPAIVSFVARNADALKEFVTAAWHNPALVEIIERIARTLL